MECLEKDSSKFIEGFASILEDYKRALEKYSLKVTATPYGEVTVCLFHRKQQQASLDVGTKAPSSLLGQYKTVFPVKDKMARYDLPGVAVIEALFSKIVGSSSLKKELDPASQLIAKTLYPLWIGVPFQLKQRAAQAMQILLSDRIAAVFQNPPIREACQEFCTATVRNCSLFRDGSKVNWDLELLGTDATIAGGMDDDSYRLRAIAVALSSSVRAPICSYLETLFGAPLSHQTTNEVHCDESLSVVQAVTSQLIDTEKSLPVATIDWQLRIGFDGRMSPLSIECLYKSAQGSFVTPELTTELMMHLSCRWERSLLGNIQALFHRPGIEKTLESMQEQASLFLIYKPREDPEISNFSTLLQCFRVPQEVIEKAFEPGQLEEYLRYQSAPQLAGTLIAVSKLPILELIPWIEKENGSPAGRMTHTYLQIEIFLSPSQITIIHRLESSMLLHEGEAPVLPTPWELTITLSSRGEPVHTALQYNGLEVESSFSNLFAPSLHPVYPPIPPPVLPKRGYLPIPQQGLFYNGTRIEKFPGEDGFFSILNLFGSQETSQISGGVEAWNCRLKTGVDPLTRRMRSLIVGFSEIPLFPVVRLLQQITPTAREGTWGHEDVKGEIRASGEELVIERTVCFTCWYDYMDLFRQNRRYPQARVTGVLKYCFDMDGRAKWGTLTRLSSDGVDLLQPPAGTHPPYEWGSRIFPHGHELENVFHNPPPRADRIQDLSRLIGETLRVFEDDVDILYPSATDKVVLDHSTGQTPQEWHKQAAKQTFMRLPALQQLIRRLGLPQQLLEASRTRESFVAYLKVGSAWEELMGLLKFPRSKEEFQERLRLQALLEEVSSLEISSPPPVVEQGDGAGTSASAVHKPSRSRLLSRALTSPSIRVTTTTGGRPSESSLSCGQLPRDGGEEQWLKDHQTWSECVETLGLKEALKGQDPNKWAEYEAEKRNTDFLFLLGLAGGQAVLAPGAILFQKMATELAANLEAGWLTFHNDRTLGRPFDGIGTTWRQLPGDVDVNVKTGKVATGQTITGYEITRHQRASRINTAPQEGVVGGPLPELAFVEWTTTFRLDSAYRLIETAASVTDIGAAHLTHQMVKETLSTLVSTWPCREGMVTEEGEADTTVCPLIFPTTSTVEKPFRSSPQYVVRIPIAHSLAALETMNGEFLENATTRALNLVNIDPALIQVHEHFAEKKASTWAGSAWKWVQPYLWTERSEMEQYHVVESSLVFGDKREVVHTIHSFLYSIERQAEERQTEERQTVIMHMQMPRSPITWKIRIKLQPNGLPCAVETHDLPEDLAKDINKQLEGLLGIESTFGPMTRSVVAGIKT